MKRILLLRLRNLLLFWIIAIVASVLPGQERPVQAAPVLQEDGPPACSGGSKIPTGQPAPACNDVKIIFLVDNSASMGEPGGNDPGGVRFKVLEEAVSKLGGFYIDAPSSDKPDMQIAVVHFATRIDNKPSWETIAPRNRDNWESERLEINRKLYDNDQIQRIVYNKYDPKRATDFTLPFQEAVTLSNKLNITQPGGCENLVVFLLTDGEPDEGQGYLYLKDKENKNTALVDKHFETVRQYVSQLNSPKFFLFILAFSGNDNNYWLRTEPYWQDINPGNTEVLLVSLEESSEGSDPPFLIDRVLATIENNVADPVKARIPHNLVQVTFTYTTTFDVYDPNGNKVIVDGDRVQQDEINSTLTITNPDFGEYRFELSEPGGEIDVKFTYPEPGGNFTVQPFDTQYQQFARGNMRFQIVDDTGTPFNLPSGTVRYSVRFEVPGDEPKHFPDLRPNPATEARVFTLPYFFPEMTPDEEIELDFITRRYFPPEPTNRPQFFTLPAFLPLQSGQGELSVDVIVPDIEGNDCLLYTGLGRFEVDPVVIVSKQAEEKEICVRLGTRVDNALSFYLANGNNPDEPTTVSLPIKWNAVAETSRGDLVGLTTFNEPDNTFAITLWPNSGENIHTIVTANVLDGKEEIHLYREGFTTRGFIQNHTYSFQITDLKWVEDNLAGNDQGSDLTRESREYGWLDPRWVDVRATIIDKDTGKVVQETFIDELTGKDVPEIERYSIEIVSGDGATLAESKEWEETGKGEYKIILPVPSTLSFQEQRYQIKVKEQEDASLSCIRFDPPRGTHLILISRNWASILVIAPGILIFIYLIIYKFPPPQTIGGPEIQDDPGGPKEKEKDKEDKEKEFKKNDLTMIEGIAREVENVLNRHGISTYEQLAKCTFEDLRNWLDDENWRFMFPETWPLQAHLKAEGFDEKLKQLQDVLKGGRMIPSAPPQPPQDDLKVIIGIGPKVEDKLNQKGITTYKKLAKRTVPQLSQWLHEWGWKSINPDTWPEQARLWDLEDWEALRKLRDELRRNREKTRVEDLKIIQGIGPKVEKLLNKKGIHNFAQLADMASKTDQIMVWLKEQKWDYMSPETWPQQAKQVAEGARNASLRNTK